jgi:hypothetical protein
MRPQILNGKKPPPVSGAPSSDRSVIRSLLPIERTQVAGRQEAVMVYRVMGAIPQEESVGKP